MIPIRVGLRDFLTYAAAEDGGPIVLDFDDAPLWSIGGDNGAGKSAIFDAVTYALYGEHRGGKQHDNRLIRKGATTAKVSLEFRHADHRYKVERTVTRKMARSGAPRPDAKSVHAAVWDPVEEAWNAIPDTDRPTELERWVRSLMGMGPETFRSSVLLRQGEADRLLTVPPNQRFKVLAGLIDLRAYQRLERLADQRRRHAGHDADLLETQLAGLATVTDADVAEAAAALQIADAAAAAADSSRREAEARHHGARHHQELLDKREPLLSRRDRLGATVADADNVRRRTKERAQLGLMLPLVQAAVEDLAAAATETTAAAEASATLAAIDPAALQAAADQAYHALRQLDGQLDALNELTGKLSAVVAAATHLHRCRKDHAQRATTLAELGDPAERKAHAERLDEERGRVRDHQRSLRERHQAAIDRRGAAQQRLNHAKQRLHELDELTGQAACSRCGQQLSAEHLQLERADAAAELEDATTDRDAQRRAVEQLDTALTKADKRLESLNRAYIEAVQAAEAAATAARELRQATSDVAAAWAECDNLATPAAAASHLVTVMTGGDLDEAASAVRALTGLHTDTIDKVIEVKERRDQARTAAEKATTALQQGTHTRTALQHKAAQAKAQAQHHTDKAELRLTGVPAEVAAAVRAGDTAILDQLDARLDALADAEQALLELEEAEAELGQVEATLRSVEEDLAAVLTEHRVPLSGAQETLELAEQKLKSSRVERNDARDHHRDLQEICSQRQELSGQLAAAHRRERAARRLAVLLGRGELQGRLLSEATAGVGAYANDTLARISGGTLEVTLQREGQDDEPTLDILVHDHSSAQEPLEVAFISGSQKFRVAVALAAGLGQYLGGSAAVRALIIDEGFGSLDTDGRQRMIQELRTLAEHLDRIIVVSHHEDFVNQTLFPNGYLLRKDGTRTIVDRAG
jgi:DNA repair exonuclease SbcCD ATPase subunit